jgi:hypothetical protein
MDPETNHPFPAKPLEEWSANFRSSCSFPEEPEKKTKAPHPLDAPRKINISTTDVYSFV